MTKDTLDRKASKMKWMLPIHIPGAARVASSIFGTYLFAYFVVWAFISPLQQSVLPGLTPYASLLFLPHGIRVLATAVLSRQAVPGLMAAALLGNYMFWGIADPVTLILVSAVNGSVTWVAFEGLRKLGIDAFYFHPSAEPPPFQTLTLAAIAASVANAFLLTSILERHAAAEPATLVIAGIVTGDMTGFLMVVMIAKLILPLLTGKPD